MGIVLLKQICIMFILIGIGAYLMKKGYLTDQGAKDLGAVLLRIVIPCVVIKSYITEYSEERVRDLAVSAAMAAVALIVAMVIAELVFRKKHRVENFAAAYCNVGFIGIPLVQAVLGEEAVFYLAAFVALLNILQWTYGVWILAGDRNAVRLKTVATNPVVLAFVVGVLLFLLRIPVPSILVSVLSSVAAMNTPLAMIILGTYVARTSVREIVAVKSVYLCSLIRLVVIPAATLLALCLIPGVRMEIRQVVLIACCTPAGSNVAIFARQYDQDYRLSVAVVCLSTALCIITVPLFYTCAEMALGL